MKETEFKEFAERIFIVAQTYDKAISNGVIKIYFEALKDFSLEQVSLVLSSAVKTLKWFPKPSEIRELVLPQDSITADEAWIEIQDLIFLCCGTGKKPIFSSYLVERACQSVGGLNGIWMAGTDQMGYNRNAFIKAFNGLAERKRKDLMIGAPSQGEARQILNKIHDKIKYSVEKGQKIS